MSPGTQRAVWVVSGSNVRTQACAYNHIMGLSINAAEWEKKKTQILYNAVHTHINYNVHIYIAHVAYTV